MALSIKNDATYQVVRQLAQVTGLSMTAAVHDAATRRLAQVQADDRGGHDARAVRVAQIVAAYQAAATDVDLVQRSEDLYDEDGLFR